ncbi:hypothetical protein LG3211_2245 [Lysobacter gummosus]|nr:hypothetical protein LG3211_2245 [Lysobacter gummosus]
MLAQGGLFGSGEGAGHGALLGELAGRRAGGARAYAAGQALKPRLRHRFSRPRMNRVTVRACVFAPSAQCASQVSGHAWKRSRA